MLTPDRIYHWQLSPIRQIVFSCGDAFLHSKNKQKLGSVWFPLMILVFRLPRETHLRNIKSDVKESPPVSSAFWVFLSTSSIFRVCVCARACSVRKQSKFTHLRVSVRFSQHLSLKGASTPRRTFLCPSPWVKRPCR